MFFDHSRMNISYLFTCLPLKVFDKTGDENLHRGSGQEKSDFANLYQKRVELPNLDLAMVYAEFIIIIIIFFLDHQGDEHLLHLADEVSPQAISISCPHLS
jgi:hypothetical protein